MTTKYKFETKIPKIMPIQPNKISNISQCLLGINNCMISTNTTNKTNENIHLIFLGAIIEKNRARNKKGTPVRALGF